MNLPAIVLGEKKESLDTRPLFDFKGELIANVCFIPGIAIPKVIQDQRRKFIRLSTDELINIVANAGKLLLEDAIDGETIDDYYFQFVQSTGLPVCTAKNGLHALASQMARIEHIVKTELFSQRLSCLNNELIQVDETITLGLAPYGIILGAVLPSNHPAVHIGWITALVMNYSIVIKPGSDDPFTPKLLIGALLAAGLPKSLVSMLPTEQKNVSTFIEQCDRTLFYGKRETIEQYRSSKIIPRGSGNSKIYVNTREHEPCFDDDVLDMVIQSMVYDGGRRCTNASSIIVNHHGDAFARCLAGRLQRIEFRDPMDGNAHIGCCKDKKTAEQIDAFIDEHLADSTDITTKYSDTKRVCIHNGLVFLRPTVIKCHDANAPLFGRELPFPFVTVLEAQLDENVEKKKINESLLSHSLAVSLFTVHEDPLIGMCIKDPTIDKVIVNAPTYASQIGAPHVGFLFPHLYRIKSYYNTNHMEVIR